MGTREWNRDNNLRLKREGYRYALRGYVPNMVSGHDPFPHIGAKTLVDVFQLLSVQEQGIKKIDPDNVYITRRGAGGEFLIMMKAEDNQMWVIGFLTDLDHVVDEHSDVLHKKKRTVIEKFIEKCDKVRALRHELDDEVTEGLANVERCLLNLYERRYHWRFKPLPGDPARERELRILRYKYLRHFRRATGRPFMPGYPRTTGFLRNIYNLDYNGPTRGEGDWV